MRRDSEFIAVIVAHRARAPYNARADESIPRPHTARSHAQSILPSAPKRTASMEQTPAIDNSAPPPPIRNQDWEDRAATPIQPYTQHASVAARHDLRPIPPDESTARLVDRPPG